MSAHDGAQAVSNASSVSPYRCHRCACSYEPLAADRRCPNCYALPPCPECGSLVLGRPNKIYCGDRCRMAAANRRRPTMTDALDAAATVLVELGEDELRDWLRPLLRKLDAAGRYRGERRRLRVRF